MTRTLIITGLLWLLQGLLVVFCVFGGAVNWIVFHSYGWAIFDFGMGYLNFSYFIQPFYLISDFVKSLWKEEE